MEKKLTQHDIIDETVEFYSNNPRSIHPLTKKCLYNGYNGEKCAFSRCCTNDSKFIEASNALGQNDAVLLPKYAHFLLNENIGFWSSIQSLHDNDTYWEENQLTDKGKNYVKDLKQQYND
jgi:hypothetical protein